MASEENELPGPSSVNDKPKRARKSSIIPLETGQRCIAAAMSKIINNMVNKQLQQHCQDLLEVKNVKDTEARLKYVLQEIDFEREDEEKIKEKAKRRRSNKKIKKNE